MILPLVSLGFALLVAVAAVALHRRRTAGRSRPGLTDEMVRRIEAEGRLAVEREEPLDLEDIREQEEEFWEESWEEPDEW